MNTNTPETSNTSEERLAKLTGFNRPSNPDSSDTSKFSSATAPLLEDEDLEEQITRHSFASSPLSKLVFVAGAVFFVVFIASLFLSQFQSTGESVSGNKPKGARENEQSPLLSPQNQDPEKSELLSELALREQQERLKDLEAEKETVDSSQPTTKPQATRQPQPRTVTRPVVQNIPVRRTPVEPVVRQPQPRPQPVAVSYRQPVPSRPVPPPTRIISPQTPSVAPVPATQLWAQLAQVGSFGGGLASNNNPPPTTRQSIPKYEPKTASTAVVEDTQPVEIPPQSSYISSVNDDNAIAFGQLVSAVLETTIAWERSRSNNTTVQHNDERYIITLAQPLKDKSGNFVIPAGSQLIAKLSGESNALVTLTTESIIVNGFQTQLPQGALTVTGVEGQPLIASRKTLGENNGGDNGQVLADVLSIAGDFADIRGTRSLSGLYRTLGGGRTRSSGISFTVFFLEEGTPLEVFVNKAFNFENSETPLELDLSLWESDGRREGN